MIRELSIPTNCPHVDEPAFKMGMCFKCYSKDRDEAKKIENCPHVDRKAYLGGMCYNCYYTQPKMLATECPHVDRVKHQNGKCKGCYWKEIGWKQRKGEIKNCPHVDKAYYMRGMCKMCYFHTIALEADDTCEHLKEGICADCYKNKIKVRNSEEKEITNCPHFYRPCSYRGMCL